MSDHEYESDSPLSQFSIEDDEVVWTQSPASDTDFIVLRRPLLDAHSLTSTLSGHLTSDSDMTPALEKLSLRDTSTDTSSASEQSDNGFSEEKTRPRSRPRARKAKLSAHSSDVSSFEYQSVTCTPATHEDASAFISRFISCPIKGDDAQLNLLRALIIELGIRSPDALDLPSTLTSARKILKAEAHVNIKEYAATRHKGQSALRDILKPSKSALRKDLRKGNRASLQWAKQQGLQVLLVTCFA